MRSGLSTILQTLTPEAASVLNLSIAEAGRRNHNQTTPLHVAATLLAAPTGFLRQACIRSHPNSSHPLQCRALELCFSVALERLPSASSSPAMTEPPVSNALMAALKRAQAHQRRGCPEQQQQPLLAVKVELEQLIISILDDPSVSRVMREASFSSPAVKATIESSLNNNLPTGNHLNHIEFRPSLSPANQVPIPINRNLYYNPRLQRNDETSVSTSSSSNFYLNPRLQQQKQGNLSLSPSLQVRIDDIKRVIEIMSKSKKKNPILVGEFEPELIRKEILMRIQKGELLKTEKFKNAEVISIDFPSEKSQIPAKIKELSDQIETTTQNIIIDLGDLKWLVEQPPTADGSDIGRESVAEMAKLATKFKTEDCNIWLIGTATCETYLRCQVYHPSMENDWDLQALPISSRSPFSGRNFMSSVESLNSLMNYTNPDSARLPPCCLKCYRDYEEEVAKLNEIEKSSVEPKSNLPHWLQNAKPQSGETKTETETKSETNMPRRSRVSDQELLKKWCDICSRIHLNDNQLGFARMGMGFVPMYKPNRVLCQSQTGQQPESPPTPVHTDLVLGPKEVHKDLPVKDYLGCISFEGRTKGDESPKGKFVNSTYTDSFKKLLKSLMKKAWWQPEAASTIATIVTQCGSRGGVLLFAGPDRMGKKKMVSVLAEHLGRVDPITICLGSRRDEDEMDFGFRGKTVLDRIVDAVRRNPFSVIVLSDIDEVDMLVRASIKKAIERRRLTDSHGREISLGNIILILTGNWSTNNADHLFDENHRLHYDWQLKLTVSEKQSKRRADWLSEDNISKKQKNVGSELSLDLNLAVDTEEDRTDTSDLTTEQVEENSLFTLTSLPHEFLGLFDATIMFKPVQSGLIRCEIKRTIKNVFASIVNQKLSIEVDEATLDSILSGLWFGRTDLEDWADQVLGPSFHKLVDHLPSSNEDCMVRLESVQDHDRADHVKDRLPSKVNVILDAV